MNLIIHNDIEAAENWTSESDSRVVILVDSNCSSCKEWVEVFPFDKFGDYEFSQMDLRLYTKSGFSLSELNNSSLKAIPLSATYSEESFENVLKNLSK